MSRCFTVEDTQVSFESQARGKFGMHRSLLGAAKSHLWNYPDD